MTVQSPSTASATLALKGDSPGASDVLAIGFGTTVVMWTVGYAGQMPLAGIPPVVFVSMMLLCLGVGGGVAGRYTRRGVGGGLWVGLLAAVLNLLILGSKVVDTHSGRIVPQAWQWVLGFFGLSLLLAVAGAAVGRRLRPAAGEPAVNWTAGLGWVTAGAALLLIAVGGLVTGFRAGMAVPDWPKTFYTNMFLYPLAKMTGGVFYEHAHRLLGMLVGISTLVLAVHLTLHVRRRGLLALVWGVGLCVALQGVLGGFRVTLNSAYLAVIHGFFAHAILGGLVAVAAMLSRRWLAREGAVRRPAASSEHFITAALVAAVLCQTLLGTLLRQLDVGLLIHITMAGVVVLMAFAVGVRAWGLHDRIQVLRRSGLTLMGLVFLQFCLGIVSVVFRTPPVVESPSAEQLQMQTAALRPAASALVTTSHQTTAALILVVATILCVWTIRLVQEAPGTLECDGSPL